MMNKPVYIIVTPFFPSPDDWRGSYCYDFAVALKKTGKYRVEVFVPGKGEDYNINGVRVHPFKTRQLPSNVLPFLWSRWNQQSFIAALERSGIEIASVAVCHGHTARFAIYPLAIKRHNKACLTLLHHHDPASFGLNLGRLRHIWLYKMLMFPVFRRLHEQIDIHVFISKMVEESFLSAPCAKWSVYGDYKKQMRFLPWRSPRIKRGVVLHNGVDRKIFYASQSSRKNSGFTIGCIGNFLDWKSQITLLKAIDGLENIKAILIGSGPELNKCRQYASEHGINAEFRSEVRHEHLRDFYNSIDLFVLPSYFEGFGCVFTEAWACGVPFITCEGQGMDDMIYEEDRSLWLCKPCDPADLAAKIKYFIENRPTQRLKGEIDIDKLVPEFVEKIEKLSHKALKVGVV